jgi:hypothetical protein
MIPSFLISFTFIKNILGGKELIGSKTLRLGALKNPSALALS